MIFLPIGWQPPAIPTPAPAPSGAGVAPETCAENVARVQEAAVIAHREARACPWCLRGASMAACTCKEHCGDSDCEAVDLGRSWKGPHLWKEKYGVPQFP